MGSTNTRSVCLDYIQLLIASAWNPQDSLKLYMTLRVYISTSMTPYRMHHFYGGANIVMVEYSSGQKYSRREVSSESPLRWIPLRGSLNITPLHVILSPYFYLIFNRYNPRHFYCMSFSGKLQWQTDIDS